VNLRRVTDGEAGEGSLLAGLNTICDNNINTLNTSKHFGSQAFLNIYIVDMKLQY
jgi:hypothetical protein